MWDGGSWRSGGVAVYNRGETFMDLCDLVWDFTKNTVHQHHPPHLGQSASQGTTSFVGLLARNIGLVRATGGMIYNAVADNLDDTHYFQNGQSVNISKLMDHSMPRPTRNQTYSANMTIDRCKFQGDVPSKRQWDEMGEKSPWWCQLDSKYRKLWSANGSYSGLMDGSEAPPIRSHLDIGGGIESGGSPYAGFLQGGRPKDSNSKIYDEGVRRHDFHGAAQNVSAPPMWTAQLRAAWRWDAGVHMEIHPLRLCRVVDADSVVLCDLSGLELPIRLGGIAISTATNCRPYYSDIVEKAYDKATDACQGAVMKKRAQMGVILLSGWIGDQVKLQLLQRYSPHGENVGRVTLISGANSGVSLSEELVRRAHVTRLYQVLI